MLSQTFFDGMVGNTYCFITSKIWTLGNHSIPTNAVSDIYVRRVQRPVWIVLCSICFATWLVCALTAKSASSTILPTINPSSADGGAANILLIVAVVFLALFFLTMKRSIVIVSKGLNRQVITISSVKNTEDYKKLYYALLDCLMDGEKYEPKNNPFIKSK